MPTTGLSQAELGQHRDAAAAAGGPEGFVESTAEDAEEDDVKVMPPRERTVILYSRIVVQREKMLSRSLLDLS